MTRQNAIAAIKDGKKVAHESFNIGEYIYMSNCIIFNEKGHFWGNAHSNPMKLRSGGKWENNWEIVKS